DQTVDLASIDTDTDDQTIDKLNLNGTTLELSLEDDGEVDQTVDLASIDTDTDDQTLAFNTSNNTLSIADGNSVDLSSLSDSNPVGTIIMWIGDENATVPTGWLVCDNRLYNTTTYPDLFALLGSDRTPNFLGRFPVGAPRDGINGATGITVGGTGGEEDKTLIDKNLPAHSHEIKFREGSEQGSNNDYSDINAPNNEKNATGSTELEGDGESFKIMPPFLGVQFLIKAE
ncbi:MAG: tail fiber protein, partial [Bacteroidota bacterium]